MPSFAYKALDGRGTQVRGVCQSADVQAGAAMLRASELFVLDIQPVQADQDGQGEPAGAARTRLRDFLGRPVTTQDRIQLLRQLCLMLRAGLPLMQALEVFANQCAKASLRRAAHRVAAGIQAGRSLSAALAQEGSLLPPLVLQMIAVGETTGELDDILERMADHFDRRSELQSSLLTSLAYPAVLIVATIGVVVFLVTAVIPKFAQLLEGRNLPMPPAAQWLLATTDWLNANGLHLLIGLGVGAVAVAGLARVRPIRLWMDRGLLALPVIGTVLRLAFVAHFASTLAVLLKSGVPILDSLRALHTSIRNGALARHVERAADEVLAGRTLAHGVRSPIIPSLLSELVNVGEISGTLDDVLDEAAKFYETRLRRKIKWMAGLLEPALILVVGGIVGFVYIAFFSVLYQVSAG